MTGEEDQIIACETSAGQLRVHQFVNARCTPDGVTYLVRPQSLDDRIPVALVSKTFLIIISALRARPMSMLLVVSGCHPVVPSLCQLAWSCTQACNDQCCLQLLAITISLWTPQRTSFFKEIIPPSCALTEPQGLFFSKAFFCHKHFSCCVILCGRHLTMWQSSSPLTCQSLSRS